MLLSVSLNACGGDDDNVPGGGDTSASIEGKWYLKSEKWFTDASRTTVDEEATYGDYADKRIWVIQKSGDGISLIENGYERSIIKVGNNEYKKGDHDRFVVKSVTSNSLVIDYYDNYYKDDESVKEYGVYTFMR